MINRVHTFKFKDEKFDVVIPSPNENYSGNKKWIEWGDYNLYSDYLISLLDKSSLHNSIIKQKANFIGGNGFDKTNLSPNALMFLKNVNNDEDLDEILYNISYDLELYGAYYLNLIWSNDRTRITTINYIDPRKVRIEAPNINTKQENYYISESWEQVGRFGGVPVGNGKISSRFEPVLYQGFSETNKKERSQILYVKEKRAGVEWYGKPGYGEDCIVACELNFEIFNFHLDCVKNGFNPLIHVNFPIGILSDEDMEQEMFRFRNQMEGSDGMKNIVTFSETPESKITIEPIQLNTSDSRFLILNDQVRDRILQSHGIVNPALFGIETAGKLGSRNEMLESLEIFQQSYVKPKHRSIEKVFNWIARINGIQDRLVINRYSPQFSKINTNITDILQILQSDITPEQKYYLLVSNEYDHTTAANLSGYHDGNNLKHIPAVSETVSNMISHSAFQKLNDAFNKNNNQNEN